MSLASSPDFQNRPEDKALKMLYPTIEDSFTDTFDQYLNQHFYDLSDDEQDKDHLADFVDLLHADSECGRNGSESPVGPSARHQKSPPVPWRKGLWCLSQPEASSTTITVEEKHIRAANACHTTSNNSLKSSVPAVGHSLNPRSPYASPSQMTKSRSTTAPEEASTYYNPYVPKPFSREATLSPSPMYARHQYKEDMAYLEWQQDFQDFHLQTREQSLPISPPYSGRPLQHAGCGGAEAGHGHHCCTVQLSRHGKETALPSIEDPYATPDAERYSSAFVSRRANFLSGGKEHSFVSNDAPSPPHCHANPTWTTEDVHLPPESERAHNCQQEIVSNSESKTWSRFDPAIYPPIAAPTPQRPKHQLLQRPSGIERGGLMINCYGEAATDTTLEEHAISGSPPATDVPLCQCSTNTTASVYPPVPQPHTRTTPYQMFSHRSTPSTGNSKHHSNHHNLSTHGSPTPPISPTFSTTATAATTTSRSVRQTSPSRPSARRKSMPGQKPSAVTKSGRAPRTPKTQHQQQGSSSSSNNNNNNIAATAAGGGGGGGAGGSGFGTLDFVNLTPRDSQKLLSDVAPSGSSKTRARREWEALEKRRKLGEAAVRAVKRAGGDVKALERAILA